MSDNDYWDSIYKSGDFTHWETDYPSPELATLVAANLIGREAKILDIGCGGGLDAIFLAQCGFNVIGVDFSKSALKVAIRRANKARVKVGWLLGSVFNLPIKNETIDFIVDRGLFHVIEDADRPKYASESFRVLKLQGSTLIRGASKETAAQDRFNPITEEVIDKYFSTLRFERGPVLPIPLFSVEGMMDSRIVFVKKGCQKRKHTPNISERSQTNALGRTRDKNHETTNE